MVQEHSKNTADTAMNIFSASIGIIYLWFGALKFLHSYSPAEALALQTINKLTFNLLADNFSLLTLAVWECFIGIALIFRLWMKPVLIIMFVHMFFTFAPFVFFPAVTFSHPPFGFSLVGQYIMKNIVIISGGYLLWQHFVKQPKTFVKQSFYAKQLKKQQLQYN